MKYIGVTRKIDRLGRIIIPKEIRNNLGIIEKDSIEIFVEGDKIILQKYTNYNTCLITGDISKRNILFANGNIVLSPESIQCLIDLLQKYLMK
ncbi:AbrB/MazE/SpoVT family DNA-binding domain-containing protein [Bacillus cereus group sp. MYBK249-1]|uniref:AbrB/MazE/SpoVT family DNA-binding domain-containing protein n=1 Tax=Bacillus cereus group TaxID=86661 RepID=UPI000279DF59|nr:AbrB/MazE/SpoVT family DNA-binding domain-containing protein [Bacillus cereus]EJR80243.1 AbrB family transcriptional regulator [Bacillus cereus VD169]HDR6958114.1 AbrB/MazE/SpoVT family DNA-binding domain-containing protein [Bacillus cereus]